MEFKLAEEDVQQLLTRGLRETVFAQAVENVAGMITPDLVREWVTNTILKTCKDFDDYTLRQAVHERLKPLLAAELDSPEMQALMRQRVHAGLLTVCEALPQTLKGQFDTAIGKVTEAIMRQGLSKDQRY